MIRVLFVCHGNICRSPMAEFVFRRMVEEAGLSERVEVASAATSTEEIGNGVYPPVRRLLKAQGIDCSGKSARQIYSGEYSQWDYIVGMDSYNLRNMQRIFGGDPDRRISLLMDYAGKSNAEVADPWYTGDFQRTWDDVNLGCTGLLAVLRRQLGE